MQYAKRCALLLGTLITASSCSAPSDQPRTAVRPPESREQAAASTSTSESACGDRVDNDRDGFVDCDDLDCRTAGKPCTLAPPLDRSVASTLAESSRFLYTGPDPIQKATDPRVFDPRRVAMVRGKVVDAAGAALSGVRISVLRHSEYGYTLSRADGVFDMAVNGGGALTFVYERDGLLPAQRAISPGWESHAQLPEVGLVPETSTSTAIKADASSAQVAVGDVVHDAFGNRQPFVVFQPGTKASITVADGSEQELDTLTVHVTEYPFELTATNARYTAGSPPVMGLHYALDLSVDEARARGTTSVRVSKPASLYVENFLKLPVGATIPFGTYDDRVGQWQANAGTIVIKVLSVASGSATLDVDGDGRADRGATLDVLGITPAERAILAKRAAAGTSLWRTRISHL